ncbi:MAG: hypothetical protein RLY61_826 [Candidatus Parcubacteria bacterium]|jgi:small subunit ribosomal protein S4
MRYLGSKNKLARHHGKDVFGTQSASLEKRLNQKPGQHGNTLKKPSTYGKQLIEKQYVKRVYGVSEKQFRNYYKQAKKNTTLPSGEALVQLLELRLDNVLYRLGIARTRPQARQFVTQKKIFVNSICVYSPSYSVKVGDKISFAENFLENIHVQSNIKDVSVLPAWLSVSQGRGIIEKLPQRSDVVEEIFEDMVVAFYSK